MEPERPIEKLLRDYSRKRKQEAGAPLEVHPATRKLLQGEIARKHAPTGPVAGPSVFWRLFQVWPRLVWGLAVLTVLGLMVALIVPSLKPGKQETSYAQEESLAVLVAPSNAAEPSPTTPAAAAPELAFNEFDRKEQPAVTLADQPALKPLADAEARVRADKLAEGSPTVAQATATPPSNNQLAAAAAPATTAEADAFRRRYGLAAGAPPAPAPPAEAALQLGSPADLARTRAREGFTPLTPPTVSLNGGKQVAATQPPEHLDEKLSLDTSVRLSASTSLVSGVSARAAIKSEDSVTSTAALAPKVQRYSKIDGADKAKRDVAKTASPADSVLISFQLQQTGPQLKIVDADGSVYSGYLEPVEAVRAGRQPERQIRNTPAGSAVAVPAANFYSFTVTGTNATLKERVVFVGNLSTVSSNGGAISLTNYNGAFNERRQTKDEGLLLKANSRISGRAKIGNRAEMEIQAVPTP
jgi:hypothetical protein